MSVHAHPSAATTAGVRRRVVAALGAAVFLNVYATQALLPTLTREFGVTSVAASLTVSATTLAIALASPLVGMLADASGRKRLLVTALLLLALPCLMIATAGDLQDVIVWRFVQGALIPGVAVVITAYIAEELPRARVPLALTAYIAGTVVGGFMGRFMTGAVADIAGWREAFVVLAVTNAIAALLALRYLPRSRNFVKQAPRATLTGLALHLRNPQLLASMAVGSGLLFALVGIFTYVNFLLAAPPYGLGPAALGSVFAVYLLGVVVTPPSGRIVARLGPRTTLTLALGMSVLGFTLTLAPALPVIIAGLAVGSCGIFIAQATATGMVALSVERARSLATGLYNAAYYTGGALGAVLVGLAFTAFGWPGAVAAACLALVAAVLTARLAWREPT